MIATLNNIKTLQERFNGVYHKNLGDVPSVVVYCPQCNAQHIDRIVLKHNVDAHPDNPILCMYCSNLPDVPVYLNVGVSYTIFITDPSEMTP